MALKVDLWELIKVIIYPASVALIGLFFKWKGEIEKKLRESGDKAAKDVADLETKVNAKFKDHEQDHKDLKEEMLRIIDGKDSRLTRELKHVKGNVFQAIERTYDKFERITDKLEDRATAIERDAATRISRDQLDRILADKRGK